MSDTLSGLEKKIVTINQNLAQAQTTIDNYRSEVNSIKISVANAKANIAAWVTAIAGIMTLIILLVVVLQVGLLLEGITLIAPERRSEEIPTEHQ